VLPVSITGFEFSNDLSTLSLMKSSIPGSLDRQCQSEQSSDDLLMGDRSQAKLIDPGQYQQSLDAHLQSCKVDRRPRKLELLMLKKDWRAAFTIAASTLSMILVFPEVAKGQTNPCAFGGGPADSLIQYLYLISHEVAGSGTSMANTIQILPDSWKSSVGIPVPSRIPGIHERTANAASTTWFGTSLSTATPSSFQYHDPVLKSNTNVNVTSLKISFTNFSSCTAATTAIPTLNLFSASALQSTSPHPYNTNPQQIHASQSSNLSTSGRAAILFSFDQPVKAFGAWFGDLETRSVANNGTPALLRLLDVNGTRIGEDIPILSGLPRQIYNGSTTISPLDETLCGGLTFPGCGNVSTRWVSFVDNAVSARVKQVLVIVGDHDSGETGTQESLSFIGTNFYSISGTVFEDKNYGGGGGRSLSTSSGVVRPGARVELYDNGGNFKDFTTTDTNGKYVFTVDPGTYRVRVVNNTVTSSRTGGSGLWPVQTFRTSGDANNDNIWDADPNRVGGEDPKKIDAAPATSTSTLTSLTSATATPQSVATVVVSSTTADNIQGVDFGFNFDTIVNTNNGGQGSLNQFITNSNALDNSTLDQAPNPSPASGTTAINPASGEETSIFMIPVNQLTAGVANINITSLLPPISGTNANKTVIDGRTQTINIGNTNVGALGVGTIVTDPLAKVGVDNLTLDPVNRPEIQITGLSALSAGLDIQADEVRVEGISIFKFGAVNTLTNADINIGSGFKNPIIRGNVIGTTATSFTDPGAGNRSNAYGVLSAATGGTYKNNLIGFHGIGGLELNNVNSSVLIENNEIRGNAIDNSSAEGTNILGGGGATVTGNLFIANGGPGIDTSGSSGGNTYVNNTITGNGIRTPAGQIPGMRILGTSNTLIDRNLIYNNYGAGILVRDASSTTNVKITRNSIYGNGAGDAAGHIGIDLVKTIASDPDSTLKNNVGDKVSLNDISDVDTGANGVLNFPVLESAKITGSNLVVKGFAPAGAAIELFISDNDASGFGEGKTYLTTVTEGSVGTVPDLDAGTGSYGAGSTSVLVNGINQGAENNAKRFKFIIPLTIASGSKLTATATVGNTTSEFSGVVSAITSSPELVLVKRVTAIGSTAITTTVDDTRATITAVNDNNLKWPNPNSSNGTSPVLKGSLNTSKVLAGEEIEYTVYFLSAGNAAIKNVNVCDLIPLNTTYVAGSGQISFNGAAATALSGGEFKAAGAVSNIPGIGLCKTPRDPAVNSLLATENPRGLVWVKVDDYKTPLAPSEYGYIRFRVLVNSTNP
jgi:uncharacterized repeat protein (TIGR01451 family)